MISSARKSKTSNPFIIYDYYNLLEKIFQDNPDLDAGRICYCDESGFPTDQTNRKCITVKGEIAFKLSFGARRENITVLTAANAARIALNPLIFKKKNLMESWFGTYALLNTYYGKSDKGWMGSEAFAKWIEKFCKDVKEQPLLLTYDGHMNHETIPVITLAMKENVIMVKLTLHPTDILQVFVRLVFHP